MRKFLFSIWVFGFLFVAGVAHAQISTGDTGLYTTGDEVYGSGASDVSIGTYIGTYIIKPILALSGIICLVSILYAGFLWMSAMGDAKQVTRAKDLMVNTIIGLLITIAAYGITQFLFSSFT